MTDVSTDHPNHIPNIELIEEGRKISFRKDCFGEIKIYRKVNNGEIILLIQQARTPYVDTDDFSKGTKLSYTIELEQEGQIHKYNLDAWL